MKSSNYRQIESVFLHFSLVFVTALGFADAVLSLPVQDLLELFLLPAQTVDTLQPHEDRQKAL